MRCAFHEIAIMNRRERMTENKGDLISREALKKAIMELPNDNPSYYYTGDLLDRERVIDEIDNAPTVEPEITDDDLRACMKESHHLGYELAEIKFKKPQGEWIKTDGNSFECPFCHRLFDFGDNYCGFCGADMQKGGKEE